VAGVWWGVLWSLYYCEWECFEGEGENSGEEGEIEVMGKGRGKGLGVCYHCWRTWPAEKTVAHLAEVQNRECNAMQAAVMTVRMLPWAFGVCELDDECEG